MNIIDEIDTNSVDEDVDVEELSRALESMEVMNELDEENKEEEGIKEIDTAKKTIEEPLQSESIEEITKPNSMEEATEHETIAKVEEASAEVTKIDEKGAVQTSIEEKDAVQSSIEKPIPEKKASLLTLHDLFSETTTLSRSSDTIPEEYNTRLFMLNQQLSSAHPDTSLIRRILAFDRIPSIPLEYKKSIYLRLLGVSFLLEVHIRLSKRRQSSFPLCSGVGYKSTNPFFMITLRMCSIGLHKTVSFTSFT